LETALKERFETVGQDVVSTLIDDFPPLIQKLNLLVFSKK